MNRLENNKLDLRVCNTGVCLSMGGRDMSQGRKEGREEGRKDGWVDGWMDVTGRE